LRKRPGRWRSSHHRPTPSALICADQAHPSAVPSGDAARRRRRTAFPRKRHAIASWHFSSVLARNPEPSGPGGIASAASRRTSLLLDVLLDDRRGRAAAGCGEVGGGPEVLALPVHGGNWNYRTAPRHNSRRVECLAGCQARAASLRWSRLRSRSFPQSRTASSISCRASSSFPRRLSSSPRTLGSR